jgi:hypothetical protein
MKGTPPLPLTNFQNSWKSISEWLSDICEANKPPQTFISEVYSTLFESDDYNSLDCLGYSHSIVDRGSVKSMDFTLTPDKYLTMHQDEFTKLSAPQLRMHIRRN